MQNVLIADDHTIVHIGLQNLLKEHFSIKSFLFVESGDQISNLLSQNPIDVVFLDISMPNNDIFLTIKSIRQVYSNVKIIVYSMLPAKTYALRTLKAGANGYIEKSQSQTEIIEAIRRILSGKKYVNDEIFYNSLEQDNKEKSGLELLSNRELDVVRLMINGDTNSTISSKMDLHPATIGTYKNRIFEKLKINSIVELLNLYKYL